MRLFLCQSRILKDSVAQQYQIIQIERAPLCDHVDMDRRDNLSAGEIGRIVAGCDMAGTKRRLILQQ